MDRPEVRYARAADGVHIAYQAFGMGRYDLVFVPGQLTHLDLAWENPDDAAAMRQLGTMARVIVLDRRGVGLSDRLTPPDTPSIEMLVEDLGVVIDAAGATRPVMFGTASGGQFASLYAAMHPDRVHGLITFGMWSHATPEERADWERWLDWAIPRWGSIESAQNDIRELLPSRASDPDAVAWVARMQRSSLSPGSLRSFSELELDIDLRDVLPTIRTPTLAMFRGRDSQLDPVMLRTTAQSIPGAEVVELPGVDHWWSAKPVEPLMEHIGGFLARLSGDPARLTRRLATVLFTDLVGSTERAAAAGDAGWRDLVNAHHRIVRTELARHAGTEVDTAGDGFFATFDGPARAVACARAVGSALESLGLTIRAGVHTGEVETIDGKAAGIGVVIGARIGALAGPGEILVSSTVKDLTAGSGMAFEPVGERRLKGVPDPWWVYRVR